MTSKRFDLAFGSDACLNDLFASPTDSPIVIHRFEWIKQGLDLIEPAADLGFGGMARRPGGPQAHGAMVDW